MTTINVELDDSLSAVQVSKIKDLLGMIRGVIGVSGSESYELANINAPEHGGGLPRAPQPGQEINIDRLNSGQKKYIISQAIAWGSKHGKITFKALERLNPEQMMSLATTFLSEMSDSEKDVIFNEIL